MTGSNTGCPNANEIRTRSYRNAVQPQPQNLHKIQLQLTIWKSQFQDGRPSYYQGPWYLTQGNMTVARGNLIAFEKAQIMAELARQVSYFFENEI